MSIPASDIVNVLPGVIGTGGNPLALNSIMLTADKAVPVGAVLSFGSSDAVGDFFGPLSPEKSAADIYFLGYDNSTRKPGRLMFAQYPAAPVAAYLRGGSLAAMTLTQLQALSGTLIVTIDGVVKTSTNINLSGATSFSNAAGLINTALDATPATVTYDVQRAAFVVTSGTAGAASTISFATGTIAAGLLMTQATGAVVSQGAIAAVPGPFMNGIKQVTQNWAVFMTLWEPDIDGKLAFATWTNFQNKRYAYAVWDTDIAAIQPGNVGSIGAMVVGLGFNGTIPLYNTVELAAFVCGAIASVNFDAVNGRITLAFKRQSGLAITVDDAQIARNLEDNGYNFYGRYATANDQFIFVYPGSVSGEFKWVDGYVNQIYMNSQFQLALMSLLTTIGSVPYNDTGYSLIAQALADPIQQAVNFGAIQENVQLSSLQASVVNQQAGVEIDDVLSTRGWYLQVLPATAQVRGLRGTPPCNFWYTDGGSVQRIDLASINIL